MLIYRLFLEIMQKLNQSVFSGLSQQIFPKLNNAYHLVIFIYWKNLSRMDRLTWLQRNYCRGSGSVSKRWCHMYAENVPLGWSFWSGQAGYLIWKERVFVQDIIRCSNFQKKPKLTLSRPIIQFYGFLFEASPHISFWPLIVLPLVPNS